MKKTAIAFSSVCLFALGGLLPVLAESIWFEGESPKATPLVEPYVADSVDISPDSPVQLDAETLADLTQRTLKLVDRQQSIAGQQSVEMKPSIEKQGAVEQIAERLNPPTPAKMTFLKSSDFMLVHYKQSNQASSNRNQRNVGTNRSNSKRTTLESSDSLESSAQSVERKVADAATPGRRDGRSTRVESDKRNTVETPVEVVDPADEHLSPQVRQLKQQIKATLASNARRTLSLQNNTPADLIAFCNAYGAETLVTPASQSAGKNGKSATSAPIYAIGSLCWNYPSSGRTLLRASGKQVIPRVGAGLQKKQAALLAMLAMSSIAENYEIRVENNTYTVADLVAFEKNSCSRGLDLSLALIGLSFYCDCNEQWKNEFGEVWSLSKMVQEELGRSVDQGNVGITDQLLGLSSVVQRYEGEGEKLQGSVLDAKLYLDSYCDFILTAQNDQGLWHPQFFLYKGIGDPRAMLYSSSNILRFLVYHLPQERLSDPKVVRSVSSLLAALNKLGNAPLTTERDYELYGTTLQSIAMYAEKVSK
ncbi:MAG: hypothetical protein ACRC10_07655 [Thermoguttaceae bacterium]